MRRLRWPGPDADELLARARTLRDAPGRAVLGIAGAPASGKSTVTEWLAEQLADEPERVAVVGMDAFHLGQRVLDAHGLAAVKGAPHTFDARGYVALLDRVRASAEPVYAPEFHREIEDSLAHVVEIGPEVGLVLTEGNYLLLPEPPWDGVRPLLDEAWFLHLDPEERRRRMVARHLRYGHSLEDARRRTLGSDEANAVRVDAAVVGPAASVEPDVFVELS